MRVAANRLLGVDAARGVALLGMMAIHVLPGVDPDGSRALSHTLAHGRSAALFAVLAGVSLGLATRRVYNGTAPWSPAVAGILGRALVIGAVGLALGSFDSGVAVILPYYAAFFVLMIPLITLPSRMLVLIAVLAGTLVPLISQSWRAFLPPALYDNPTFDMVAERPLDLLRELLLTGYYPALPWLAYLATGLAVSHLSLRSTRTAWSLVIGGGVLALAARGASRFLLDVAGGREAIAAAEGLTAGSPEYERLLFSSQYGTTPTSTWWWLAVDNPHSSTPFDFASTIGTALLVLGLALLIAHHASWLLVPLAAAGSMTLTLYTAHVMALALAPLPADPQESYLLQVVAVLLIGFGWRLVFRRGPLEMVTAFVSLLATYRPARSVDPNRTRPDD